MQEPNLIDLFARPLQVRGFRYLIVGSLGAMLYGEPRSTMDIDLAVALEASQLAALPEIFAAPDFYCPPQEVLLVENGRECRGHFNVIHVNSGLKADFYPSQHDSFFAYAWRERRETVLGSSPLCYAPPEYVILWKVVYYAEGGSNKHVRDIQRMLELSTEEIDFSVLSDELSRRNLLETFQKIVSA